MGCNIHTNPIEKRLKLLSVSDIHQLKLFCLYKKLTDRKLPNYITKMFENMNLDTNPTFPKLVKYRNTIRFVLPTFLQTAPSVLLGKSQSISYCYFKSKVKEHILERYSSLCTVVGCRSCHLRMHISWFLFIYLFILLLFFTPMWQRMFSILFTLSTLN